MDGVLLLDFDGTLYRGDAPYQRYSEILARSMSAPDAAAYRDLVERHLRGEAGVVAGDNWEAVVLLARRFLPNDDRWQDAFLETRAYMLGPECHLEVPNALPALLADARGKVHVVVASNSPEAAVRPLLAKLGLLPYCDCIVPEAGKPEGLVALADAILRPEDPTRIFTVGDNYVNDIAPGLKRGWKTGHISPHGYFPGPADFRGRRLEDVLPGVRRWLNEIGTGSG